MSLTTRGERFLAAIVVLLALGLLFVDAFFLAASLTALALLVYDMLDARSTTQRGGASVRFSPVKFQATLARGDSASFKATLTADRRVALDISETPWIEVEPSNFEPGDWPVLLTGSSSFTGQYSTKNIHASVTSRYGFFSTTIKPELFVGVRVYPRFLKTTLAIAEALLKSGAGMGDENETELIGPGLEYAETRQYQPGDSLRRIDWKATARFSSLMVKQFYWDIGGSVNLVYLIEAPGPRTHDELATAFLDIILSTTSSGTPVTVAALDRGRTIAQFSGRGHLVLASALSLVLEKSGVSLDEVYSLLDVVPASQERKALLLSGRVKLVELLERARKVNAAQTRSPSQLFAEVSAFEDSRSFVVLSSLVSHSPHLPDMIESPRARGCDVLLAYPQKPWEDATDLEDAYMMSVSQKKLVKFAESNGCALTWLPLRPSESIIPLTQSARVANLTNR
ncbi:MAG: DUF58 domain-containing protein [Thaumarchaeota archaeon]|nr:DUF58 domain-containing protein [Nitrososphaerota archaeon]